jgi:hypothetical protein
MVMGVLVALEIALIVVIGFMSGFNEPWLILTITLTIFTAITFGVVSCIS